jgi:hypothetical protein
MVIGNLNIEGVAFVPAKADPVLIVDAVAVLSFAVAFQGFQLVAGNCGQIAHRDGSVNVNESAERNLFDGLKLFRELLPEDLFGFGVSKRANHLVDCISMCDKRQEIPTDTGYSGDLPSIKDLRLRTLEWNVPPGRHRGQLPTGC